MATFQINNHHRCCFICFQKYGPPIFKQEDSCVHPIFIFTPSSQFIDRFARNPMEVKRRLIPCLVQPLVNPQWWEKIWSMVSRVAAGTPAPASHATRTAVVAGGGPASRLRAHAANGDD